MSALALIGGLAVLLLREEQLQRLLLPAVAFSAGSLLGGGLFAMLPAGIHNMGHGLAPFVWAGAGFFAFFCLEQFLHWHHCHRSTSHHHRPLTYLLLVADGVHNLLGGLAAGAAFVVDIRLGIVTWLVEAAHEIPQEIGDFGVLVYGGWSVRKALLYNFLSGLTYLVGGLIAYFIAKEVDVTFVVPFTAGSFIYIAAVDLVPEVNKHPKGRGKFVHMVCFLAGFLLLLAIGHVGGHAH
jgi:zinc and cadmium transporter